MANEIVALTQNGAAQIIEVLFLFPITTPIQVGGANVVPTPSASLPPLAAAVLTTQEKAALDAGTGTFTIVQFERQGMNDSQLLAAARARYTPAKAAFDADYASRYAYAGRRFDA